MVDERIQAAVDAYLATVPNTVKVLHQEQLSWDGRTATFRFWGKIVASGLARQINKVFVIDGQSAIPEE